MWLPTEAFDAEACAKAPSAMHGKARVPLAALDILWYYSGKGIIPQGYPDPDHEMARPIRHMMQQADTEFLSKDLLRRYLLLGHSDLGRDSQALDNMWALFQPHAKIAPHKGLHLSELSWTSKGGVPLDAWLKLAAEGDPEGGLPCDRGQKYYPRPVSEYARMDRVLRDIEDGKLPGASKKNGWQGSGWHHGSDEL